MSREFHLQTVNFAHVYAEVDGDGSFLISLGHSATAHACARADHSWNFAREDLLEAAAFFTKLAEELKE